LGNEAGEALAPLLLEIDLGEVIGQQLHL